MIVFAIVFAIAPKRAVDVPTPFLKGGGTAGTATICTAQAVEAAARWPLAPRGSVGSVSRTASVQPLRQFAAQGVKLETGTHARKRSRDASLEA